VTGGRYLSKRLERETPNWNSEIHKRRKRAFGKGRKKKLKKKKKGLGDSVKTTEYYSVR